MSERAHSFSLSKKERDWAQERAIKTAAQAKAAEKNAKILVVCVELCTLHFQPKDNHDNLLSNTIFGDGAAALIITPDNYAQLKGLKLLCFYFLYFHNIIFFLSVYFLAAIITGNIVGN